MIFSQKFSFFLPFPLGVAQCISPLKRGVRAPFFSALGSIENRKQEEAAGISGEEPYVLQRYFEFGANYRYESSSLTRS